MTLTEDAAAITDIYSSSPESDVSLLGDLIQPQDRNHSHVSGDNYTWWLAIGAHYRPKRIAELGTRFGYSMKALVLGADHHPDQYHLAAFDSECNPGDKNPLGVFVRYFGDVLKIHSVRLERVDTQTLTALNLPHPPDLVVVDADHSYKGCYHDCGLAFAAVRPGAVVAVDDTRPGEVRDAAEAFCRDNHLEFVYLPSQMGIHLFRKPQ